MNTDELLDVYAFFEVGVFHYLVNCGYEFDVYTNTQNYSIYDSADICIEKYGFPILKKKTFDLKYYELERQVQILQYLVLNRKFDINHILVNAERQYGFNVSYESIVHYEKTELKRTGRREPKAAITSHDLQNFFQMNKRVYIYGTGVIARRIWYIYHPFIVEFCGFVVSDNQELKVADLYGFPVSHYSCINSEVPIVIALNPENSNIIKRNLKSNLNVKFLWNHEENGESDKIYDARL